MVARSPFVDPTQRVNPHPFVKATRGKGVVELAVASEGDEGAFHGQVIALHELAEALAEGVGLHGDVWRFPTVRKKHRISRRVDYRQAEFHGPVWARIAQSSASQRDQRLIFLRLVTQLIIAQRIRAHGCLRL